jgi:hypothetical protein
MPRFDDSTREALQWLVDIGLSDVELSSLNPCVPGEFTLPEALYVNTATPGAVYGGAEEGTLPPTAGRWYMLPSAIPTRYPVLRADVAPVARAARSLQL